MNKLILFLGAAFLCMGVSAQEPRESLARRPGFQNRGGEEPVTQGADRTAALHVAFRKGSTLIRR